MTRPAHTLVEYSGVFGSLASPVEEWSVGFRCSGTVAVDSLATVAAAAETAWSSTVSSQMPANVVLTRTRVANIKGQDSDDVAGRIARNADGSFQLADEAGNIAGATAASTMPAHVALVASLVTARPGATGKGRVFFPWPGYACDTDRLLPVADATYFAGQVKDLIVTLNAIGILGPVSVVSSKGYSSPVTAVRIGKVPDTQRSRRNRREEGYVQSSF